MKNLNFDSGIREYAINGDESRVIRICVTDMNLGKRIADCENDVEQIAEKYGSIEHPDMEQLFELDREVRAVVDKAFGAGVSETAFGTVNCCSPVGGGKLLFEGFVTALAAQIKADVQAAAQQRVRPEVAAYLPEHTDHPPDLPQIDQLTEAEKIALLKRLLG